MLNESNHTLVVTAPYNLPRHFAGQKRVFGIILEVSSAERRTVNIARRRVPARVSSLVPTLVADKRLVANHNAKLFGDIYVPGRTDKRFAGVITGVVHRVVAHKQRISHRSVGVDSFRFVYISNSRGVIVSRFDKRTHLRNGELV